VGGLNNSKQKNKSHNVKRKRVKREKEMSLFILPRKRQSRGGKRRKG
jgi:hypothetical protein